MEIVRIISAEEHEFAELSIRIGWRISHIEALEAELGPLQRAFEQFEWAYSQRVGRLAAELQTLRNTVERMELRTRRIHARLIADPEGVLGDLFDRDELQEIGEMFGIDVPDEWFRRARPGSANDDTGWAWGDNEGEEEILRRMQGNRKKHLPDDQARELRTRYRNLARRFHPDLASSDDERSFRQEIMLRINHAWQCQDLAALCELEEEMDHLVPGWSASHMAHRVAWARREYERLGSQATTLMRRIRQLRSSKTFPLWFNPTLGQSTIANRAAILERDLSRERERLEEARAAFQQALAHYAVSIA
jgi:hypothetical protein